MSPTPRPAWPWRLLAWILLVLGAAISLPALLFTPGSGMIYILVVWISIGGAMAYAYGRRVRPLWFWRLFSVLLSLYVMKDIGDRLPRFVGALFGDGGMSGGQMAVFVVSIPLNILLCVALLRHARLLRGGERAAMRELKDVFA